MKAATATPRSAPSEALVFLLDREEFGVDILKVQEIRGYEKPTPIPSAPPYLKGVVNLRGTVVPIIDLRTKFGFADPKYDALTVTIILRLSGRIVGVVVNGVSDAIVLEQGDVKPAPDLGGLADAAFIEGIATRDTPARTRQRRPREGGRRETGGPGVWAGRTSCYP